MRKLVIKNVGKHFVPLAIHSLGGLQSLIFVRKSLLADVSVVHVADVPCGVGNVLHNKGGIGVFVGMKRRGEGDETNRGGEIYCFVNSHLAAHERCLNER